MPGSFGTGLEDYKKAINSGCFFQRKLRIADALVSIRRGTIRACKSLLQGLSQGLVLSYENTEAEGSAITDFPDDALLQSIGANLNAEDGALTTLQGPAGKYYAVFHKVQNTDWYFVAYAPTKDVLKDIIKEMTAKVQDLSKKSEANNKMISESSTAVETAANSFQEIYEELSETNRVMEAMAKKMEKVNDVATNMASVAEEQGASTEEISATIENLAESSRKVANGSQEVANTSETVEGASSDILKAVKEFHI